MGDLFETPYIYHPHLGGESGYGGGQQDVERYRISVHIHFALRYEVASVDVVFFLKKNHVNECVTTLLDEMDMPDMWRSRGLL